MYGISRLRCPRLTKMSAETDGIAFDVYKPNAKFRKTNPGLPDYYVAICCFTDSLSYMTLDDLVKKCDGIPLRMATVADGGTVVMFGLTDYGVPVIK